MLPYSFSTQQISSKGSAGLTLVELLITVALLLMASTLAATAINWVSNLLRLPNPSPAVESIDLVRDIYNSTSVTQDGCSLRIIVAGDITKSYRPTGSIACYQYDASSNILRVYGHRTPNSCKDPSQVLSADLNVRRAALRVCEYEEQAVTTQLFSAN